MKKIVLAIFVFLFLTVGQAQAAGLVPCGDDLNGNGTIDPGEQCSFCDFFKMVDKILDFVLVRMVPVVAVLMLVIGGGMLFFAGADPGMLTRAKSLITSTLIGLVIIFAAFLIVGTILSAIGLAGWTQDIYKNWWQEGFFQIPGC